jgi:hypothetical protein
MVERFHCGLMLVLCAGAFACGSDAPSRGAAGTGSTPTAGHTSSAAGVGSSSAGTGVFTQPPVVSTAGSNGSAGTNSGLGAAGSAAAGSGGSAASSAGAGGSHAGTGASAGSGGASAGAGGSSAGTGGAGGSGGGTNTISGTLGALGAAKPIMNAWATTNGPETLIYFSSAPLSCADMMTMGVKWLSKLPAGTQVIEVVVPGAASVKTYMIGTLMGEVNYAEGSKSSATEVTGKAGSITFTKAMAKGVHEGSFMVTSPFMVTATFHAEWCQGGAEY